MQTECAPTSLQLRSLSEYDLRHYIIFNIVVTCNPISYPIRLVLLLLLIMNRDSAPDTYGPSSPSTASDDYHTNERRKDSGDPAIEGSTEAEEQRTEGPQQTTETRESHFFDSIDILTKWMKGFVWDPNLFENRDFAVEELQAGFHGGYALITDTLDMEMQAVIDTANNPYHNIDVKMEDMYETRESVWSVKPLLL